MRDLPTTQKFQDDTKHVVKESKIGLITSIRKETSKKKGRGGISTIDDALDRWHQDKNKPQGDQAIALYLLFKACRRWLKSHRAKPNPGPSTATRLLTVEKLLVDVESNLVELVPLFGVFERKKDRGVNPRVKSLSGVYQHERSLYVKNKKTYAPSGTQLDGFYQETLNKKFKGKKFSELTESDYQSLDKIITAQENKPISVLYLTKLERLDYLVRVNSDDGLLYDANGAPFNTKAAQHWRKNSYWAWTMDQYGNLFSLEDLFVGEERDIQVNHSSFNSGRDIICGGLICVDNGKLVYIDNSSGHYKPDSRQLLEALAILGEEGCNLDGIEVGAMAPPKQHPDLYSLEDFRNLVMGTQPLLLPPEPEPVPEGPFILNLDDLLPPPQTTSQWTRGIYKKTT